MNIRKASLDFSGKGLTEFPKEVFEVKRLYKLNLSRNKIKVIPREIEQLQHLETLDLSGNQIRQVYAKLFELQNLRILILNNNEIVSLPKQIEKLQRLKILNLANNKLSMLPYELAKLPFLEELNITGNLLNSLPLDFELFQPLKKLWIAQNPLIEVSSEDIINNAPNLKSLYCYSPKLDTPIVSKDNRLVRAATFKGNCFPFLKQLMTENTNSNSNQYPINTKKIDTEKKATQRPPKIFISYAHADAEYLERLRRHLKALSFDFEIEVWDDTKIRSSEKWKEAIDKALDEASIAILLVSTDFLASDFIRSNELPLLLKAAEEKGVPIYPVIVHPCRFLQTKSLSQFQAVNSPSEALSECERPKQERIWMKLCNDITAHLNQ